MNPFLRLFVAIPSFLSRESSSKSGRLVASTAALLLVVALPMSGAGLRVMKGHVPHAVVGLRPLRRLEAAKRIDLAIGLPLRNQEALTNLIEQLYNPASPSFHQYLTPAQFTDRFGPTEDDYQVVLAFAKSNHLTVTGIHPNRMLLDVNGAVADIERAFHLKLEVYQHPYEARTFYSPDAEPSLDPNLPVLSIDGLDDFFRPRPMDLKTQLPALDATGSGPAGTFIGPDFRAAYAPGLSLDGTGESVGLVALDNYYPSDIAAYEDVAGIPHVPLTNVLVNGFNRLPSSNNSEVALDIEMAISMAPGVSRVIVYEGAIGNDILNRMATDNLARQLSCSWSFGHQIDATREQIFQQFAAQGQSIFQASGDAGAYGPGMFPPADDPFVTAVGGTSLVVTRPDGAWSSETAWFGSGGGTSANYTIPVWQKAVSMASNQGSTSMRNVPDVAALADATIWIIANNGEQGTVGGTSAAAPLWAGFAALVNQQAAANHQPGIGFVNPALYAIGQGPAYSSAFHDVTSGNNTNNGSPNRFYAVTGYDLCTGWGSPTGSNLVTALLAPPDALQIGPTSNVLVSGPVGGPFSRALESYTLTNLGSGPLSWALGATSTWLNLSLTSGTLVPGGPATTVNISLNAVAGTLPPGSYLANLWFTNLNDGFFQARQFSLDIVTPPVITAQPASQTLPTGATAQFVVHTATNALLFYQWQLNGIDLTDGGNITGSATPTLTLTNVTSKNNGTYSLLLTNVAGSMVSLGALLTVTSSAPIIVLQPMAQTALPGANALFFVEALGDQPLSYQWRGSGTNLLEGANVSGSTSSMLTLSGVSSSDSKAYSVVVSNHLGFQTSSDAALDVVTVTTPEIAQAVLYAFSGEADGGHPHGLMRGRDGLLYGTTQNGGAQSGGTLFQLDTAGHPIVVYSFTGAADGSSPNGGLLQSADGQLLGTTFGGGSNGFGTVFSFGTNSGLKTLFAFDHTNGVLPTAGLTQGSDGNFYGTAYEGGVLHFGTVFRFATNSTFTTLFAFDSTNGAFPHGGLVQGSDGMFYGTTYKAGIYGNGTVFRMSPSGRVAAIASFDGTNGAFPFAGLTAASDGNLFGTATFGGASGLGCVFGVSPAGAFTNLISFNGAGDGAHPRGAMIQGSDGNLYGTTADGGSFGDGTIFRIAPEGALTTIVEFDGFNGANPESPLFEDQDGTLYGTTENGGPYGQGVIYRLSIPSSPPQITSQPASLVTYSGSSVTLSVALFGSPPLYYQWMENGTNLPGAISRTLSLRDVTPANAGAYSVAISNAFGSVLSTQAFLQVLVSAPFITQQPTNLTLVPGATAIFKAGVLGNLPLNFQWQANGTNLADAGSLSGSATDTLTIANVTEANNNTYSLLVSNNLGRTNSVAANLLVVPTTSPGTRLSTLFSFTGGIDGANPSCLVDGHDGYLYGTTQLGGNFSDGTGFRLGTNGELTTLVSFDQTNGSFPLAGLVLSSNGNFFGTTTAGGSYGFGTAFQIQSNGALTTIHAFTGGTDGASPQTTLVQGADGNFYGSGSGGGAFGQGTVFEMTPQGAFTTLHSFTGGLDGASPDGALLQLPEGSFYCITPSGGTFNQGTVLRISPSGVVDDLYSFTGGVDGYNPVGSLVQGDDGALYGATESNTIRGFSFYGTLFKVTTNGGFTTLYALNFTDGSYPTAGLVLGSDGNFYGTTQQGGANNYGTVFRMTSSGVVSTLVEFDGFNDGANPLTALTQGIDGNMYGTASTGGPGGHGTIFRLSFTGAPQITGQPANQTAFTGAQAAFSVAVTGTAPLAYQWQKNGTNLTDSLTIRGSSSRILTLSNLTIADTGSYSVSITNTSGLVVSTPALLNVQLSPPSFQSVSRSGANLLFSWTSTPGRTYQLQSTPALPFPNWTNVSPPLTATGNSLNTSIPIGPNSPQFYRVELIP